MTNPTINLLPSAAGAIQDADKMPTQATDTGNDNTFLYTRSWAAFKAYVLSGLTASSVANVPAGGVAATNVQAAINELDTDKLAIAGHAANSLVGRSAGSTGDVADIAASADGQFLGRASGALSFQAITGALVSNTPAGNVAATTTQGAIDELDADKAGLTLANTFTDNQTVQRPNGSGSTFLVIGDNAAAQVSVRRYSNTAVAAALNLGKALGDFTTPVTVATGSVTGTIAYQAYTGAGFTTAGSINCIISEATPSSTALGAQFRLNLCPTGSGSTSEVFRLDHTNGFQMFGSNPVIDANRLFRLRVYTVATLPAAGTAGRHGFVSDANAPVFGAAVAGGGAVGVPVYDTGAAWFVG